MHQVRYYDGIEAMVPREELYKLPPEKFEADCAYILACEESLVGQAVVARNDDDGTFHLGMLIFFALLCKFKAHACATKNLCAISSHIIIRHL